MSDESKASLSKSLPGTPKPIHPNITQRTRNGPTGQVNSTIDLSMIQNDGTLNQGFCEEPSMTVPVGAIPTHADPNLKPSMENWNILVHLSKENRQLTEENEKLKRSADINREVLLRKRRRKRSCSRSWTR